MIKKIYNYSGEVAQRIVYINENTVKIKNSSWTFYEHYIYQNEQLITQVNTDGNKRAIHDDYLGSVSLITDSNGNVVENELYSPYGEQIEGGEESRYDYTGKEKDENTGEYDFDARMYKAEWGRFSAPDTVIQNAFNPKDLNHYVYVRNNPFLFYDPDGHVVVIFEGGQYGTQSSGSSSDGARLGDVTNTFDSGIESTVISNRNQIEAAAGFVRNSLERNSNQPVVMVGHSAGGVDAIALKNYLEENSIVVDLVITIDPTNAETLIPGGSPGIAGAELSESSININFLQDEDYPRGEVLEGVTNILLDNTGGHRAIDTDPRVTSFITRNVNRIHQRSEIQFSIDKDGYVVVTRISGSGRLSYEDRLKQHKALAKASMDRAKGKYRKK